MRYHLALTAVAATLFAARAPAATPASIDAAAHSAMAGTGAQGLALALIEGGRITYVHAYGLRNAKGDPLQTDTVMYGASITKAVFAYAVMQLVDEGRIDLDRPLASYLAKPLPDYGNVPHYGNWGDLAGDDRWKRVTARNVLTHSTGFANFAALEDDGKLRFHFDPGTRYAYSGEGMELLQFTIDRGLGLDSGAEVQRRVFDRFGMANTSLMTRADFPSHWADGWTAEGKPSPHDNRSHVRAAGSMDTTIADLAKFAAGLVRGDGLSAKAKAEMVRPQLAITTGVQFPPFSPELLPTKRLPIAAGLGVVTFSGPQGPGFYKGGHDDQTGNTLVCVERARKCALILSNDVRIERAFPDLVRALIGETGTPWKWEYGDLVR